MWVKSSMWNLREFLAVVCISHLESWPAAWLSFLMVFLCLSTNPPSSFDAVLLRTSHSILMLLFVFKITTCSILLQGSLSRFRFQDPVQTLTNINEQFVSQTANLNDWYSRYIPHSWSVCRVVFRLVLSWTSLLCNLPLFRITARCNHHCESASSSQNLMEF